jgi:hypothetical protein
MAERRYYRVAEHLFSIEAPEEMLAPLTNYEPFRVWNTPSEVQFSLTIGIPPLDTEEKEHVYTDTSDEEMPRIEVYRVKQNWLFCIAISRDAPVCSRMLTTPDFRQAWLEIDTPQTTFAINNAAMLLYAFSTAHLQTLEMHAAVAVRQGKGYLFLGKSGTGKSTHARQWFKAFDDAWLLNDDNPVLRLYEQDGKSRVVVYGSPWSGKTPCYRQVSYPLGGIVLLSQAPYNKIERLGGLLAYAALVQSISGKRWDERVADGLHQTENALVASVAVWHLACLPDEAAAKLCNESITR